MNSESRSEIRRIFIEASELPAAERLAHLDKACAGNARLRAEVEALLAALDRAGLFLSEPTLSPTPETLTKTTPHSPGQAGGPLSEGVGSIIGPYKLIKLLGEGGFGSVYLAEQSKPVERSVAFKIIKLGMDTRQVVARFDAERQALAMMEHPNIARVFDAGATAAGRPFFVMELVKGEPITEYCDKNSLTIRERLELFEQVCIAVQHAHMKGIMHRDIKPSNVLVSMLDGKPVIKIIDFGIAKAIEVHHAEKSVFTQEGQWIGTPAYMSPEQAAGTRDIDTRTDVYSLGVLLYELLTGTTPFDMRKLRWAAYQEMLRIICEEEPPKPSSRLSQTADTLASVAALRSTEPRRLGTTVRGDLDWIVMKALEKQRQRRYDTPSGFAADVRRYLAGEPVVAAPPSRVYRVRKFVSKHRGIVGTIVTIISVLIAATSVSLIALSEKRQALAGEIKQRRFAEDTGQFLVDAFTKSDPFRPGPRYIVAADSSLTGKTELSATDVILQGLDSLSKGKFDDQPTLKSKVLDVSATVFIRNSDAELAVAPAKEALDLQKAQHSSDNADVAHSMYTLATAYQDVGRLQEAEALFASALAMARRLNSGDHADIAEYLSDLAVVWQAQGRYSEAEPALTEALAMYRRLHPGDDPDLAAAINNLARVKAEQYKATEAEPLYEEALAMRRRLFRGDHPFVAMSLLNLADVQIDLKKLIAAEQSALAAYEMCLRHPKWRADLHDRARGTIEFVLRSLGKADQLITIFSSEVARERNATADGRRTFAGTLASLASQLLNLGSSAASREAISPLRESLAIREREYPDDNPEAWKKYNAKSLLGEAILGSAGIFPATSQPTTTMAPASRPDPAAIHDAFVEAEPLLLQAWEHMRDDPNVLPPGKNNGIDLRQNALRRVVLLYEAWNVAEPDQGHDKQAAEWRAKLEAYSTTQPGG